MSQAEPLPTASPRETRTRLAGEILSFISELASDRDGNKKQIRLSINEMQRLFDLDQKFGRACDQAGVPYAEMPPKPKGNLMLRFSRLEFEESEDGSALFCGDTFVWQDLRNIAESDLSDRLNPDKPPKTPPPPVDRCSHGIAILVTANQNGKIITVTKLKECLNVTRQQLYENKEFARLRDMANSLFGLFGKKAKKRNCQARRGSKSRAGTIEAYADEEPIEDRAAD